MIRVIVFLALIALAAAGAAWVADQTGEVVLTFGHWRVESSFAAFVLALGLTIVGAVIAWSLLRAFVRAPKRLAQRRRERRDGRGRHAIVSGLLAVGHGDAASARGHADVARRLAGHDPLTLLLHAQSAQLDGNADGAARAFRAMAERPDTRLLGLRGLFIEAQRADDAAAAGAIAEEALRTSPGAAWAAQAVLGLRCAQDDWHGALGILERESEAGLLDKATYRRHRAVLLTGKAMALETADRDVARDAVYEAVRLAPTLVPAAVLAAKFYSEAQQIRRAMRVIEPAWTAAPHPDLADAYAHVKLGDSARQRLVRTEALAAMAPGHPEAALALARAALDASEFARARDALQPLLAAPTQRAAMLMAEIERSDGDNGRARAWTRRAVHAAQDPVWTADGYMSAQWRPLSPVTGRLDAFRWQAPLAALPGAERAIDTEALYDPDPLPRVAAPDDDAISAAAMTVSPEPEAPIAAAVPVESEPADPEPDPVPVVSDTRTAPAAVPPPPLFRQREAAAAPRAPAIIPLVRAPDDPGIDDDESARDEFAEQLSPPPHQAGGWRGFVRRWGG